MNQKSLYKRGFVELIVRYFDFICYPLEISPEPEVLVFTFSGFPL